MLYLAIDLHGKQLTVSVRNESGETIQRRQVSTEWERVRKFLAELAALAAPTGGFVAMLDVGGSSASPLNQRPIAFLGGVGKSILLRKGSA